MGDVLAGVLGALRVQTRDLAISARAGVLLHALAGDAAAASGERGTVAGGPHARAQAMGESKLIEDFGSEQSSSEFAGAFARQLATAQQAPLLDGTTR